MNTFEIINFFPEFTSVSMSLAASVPPTEITQILGDEMCGDALVPAGDCESTTTTEPEPIVSGDVICDDGTLIPVGEAPNDCYTTTTTTSVATENSILPETGQNEAITLSGGFACVVLGIALVATAKRLR